MTCPETVARCLAALEADESVRRATIYVDPRTTVKVTRQHKVDRRQHTATYIVTSGRPNYREREWIKTAKRAGVTFPVSAPQLNFWPKERAK